MFQAVVNNFVHAVGGQELIGVSSLDEADNLVPLRIVVKKNRRWFWQRPKFYPSEFSLNDILTNRSALETTERSFKFMNYMRETTLSIHGKFAAKLQLDLMTVTANADDEINVNVKLGDLSKDEIDAAHLQRSLEVRKVDFHHPLVKQVHNDPRLVLCVIVGVVRLKNDGELHSQLKLDNDAEIKSDCKLASVDAKLDIDDEKTKMFTIPAGTALAYYVYEMLISKSGRIELIVVDGGSGGFDAKDDVDLAIEGTDVPVDKLFQGIYALTERNRAEFRVCIDRVMSAPKMVLPLLAQFKKAYKAMSGDAPKTISVPELIKSMPTTDDSLWKPLLQQADFTFKSDDTVVLYPEDQSAILESFRNLFEVLAELEDDELQILKRLTATQAHGLINLLRQTLFKKDNLKKNNPDFAGLFADEPYAKSLLSELQYSLDGNSITPPGGKLDGLHATYRLVSALWE